VLKTAHEGDEVTKITNREMIEGELGRFILNQGEEPQAMYNWLKTLVNQVRNLGSTKWDDHEMVKVILRSLVFRNPTQLQLIHGDPRYKLMSPEKVIGKFVSFELMIKGSKQIVEQGTTSTPEVQPIAFKATKEKKEESTSSRLPIDASKLDNEEMALIIKSFRQILKQRKGRDYKPCSKKVCYKCGKPENFIAKCPLSSDSDRGDNKKGKRKCRRFEPEGSLDQRVNCRRVPQPRWVGARRSAKGGEKPEGERRKRGNPRPSCLSRAQVGCACSRGLQASAWERARGLCACCPVLPRAANPL
jgi:hypothetical protein